MDISPILAFMQTENKLDCVLYMLGVKKTIVIKAYGLRFKIQRVQLTYVLAVLYNVFQKHIYNNLDVKGRTVIDVGGFIGDSAIYFASKGARKVYSIEAYHQLAQLIRENARLNGFEIEVINVAISPKHEIVYPTFAPFLEARKSGWRKNKVRGGRISNLPKADLLKINLDYDADSYIVKEMPLLKRKYRQIYWKQHLQRANKTIISKHAS
jgi:tRNA G37 N-methylase Trm5